VSVVLHVSDPHFGTERAAAVEALVAFAHQQRPDLLVLSGDITQRARRGEFQAARAFMDRLGAPLLALPGNHDLPLLDLWTRLRRPYAPHIEGFGSDLEPVYCSPELLVQCVNTTRAWRHKNGEVSLRQIERVAARLAGASAAQLRLVVVHQPVAVSLAEDLPNLLRGHAHALRRWAAAGADAILGGHIHLPYVTPVHGLVRPLWAVQAGTAVSSRVRRGVPNSVNLLRWGRGAPPGTCQVEQWDLAAERHAFLQVAVTPLVPARKPAAPSGTDARSA
jgi:3',5'-cyclic AMP phosphodiesterase CpdA